MSPDSTQPTEPSGADAGPASGRAAEALPGVTAVDALGLVVPDLPAAAAFYRLLGLAFPPVGPDDPHAEAALPGGLRLMLDSEAAVRAFDPGFEPPRGRGRAALAVRCADAAAVDAVYAAILAAGHRGYRAPFDAPWGQRYAMVLDPADNTVDLYAALPGGA